MEFKFVFSQQQMQQIVNHLKKLPYGDVIDEMDEIRRQDLALEAELNAELAEENESV